MDTYVPVNINFLLNIYIYVYVYIPETVTMHVSPNEVKHAMRVFYISLHCVAADYAVVNNAAASCGAYTVGCHRNTGHNRYTSREGSCDNSGELWQHWGPALSSHRFLFIPFFF